MQFPGMGGGAQGGLPADMAGMMGGMGGMMGGTGGAILGSTFCGQNRVFVGKLASRANMLYPGI